MDNESPTIQLGYPQWQLAKALRAAQAQPTWFARVQAETKAHKWAQVIDGMLSGSLNIGARQPVQNVPVWATLEVITGGFATGGLLAGGALQPHEAGWLATLDRPVSIEEGRRLLNRHFLTEDGLAQLNAWLRSGQYKLNVPEEGALLVVAWLTERGESAAARALLDTLLPYFDTLRFYPVPAQQLEEDEATVFLKSVGQVIGRLSDIIPTLEMAAQTETINVWLPLYDQLVALFLETVEGEIPEMARNTDGDWTVSATGRFPVIGGWPCQHYPADWRDRAQMLLDDIAVAQEQHRYAKKPNRRKESFWQLHHYLERCVRVPQGLTGREIGRIRLILARTIATRGAPNTPQRETLRTYQRTQIAPPTHEEIAERLIERLQAFPSEQGLHDVAKAIRPITLHNDEIEIPPSIQRIVQRALIATPETLVEKGIVTSGDTLAVLMPKLTAHTRTQAISNPTLRSLYAALYRAFRARRSLMLLDLQHQVQFAELPWVAAIEPFRSDNKATQQAARAILTRLLRLNFIAFPHAILPNKLLQEVVALSQQVGLDLPLVEEVAADIFMGQFSPKFGEAAELAGELLAGTLYATYYEIEYAGIGRKDFAQHCIKRAGLLSAGWGTPAPQNGMVIEQQQILTTQNLAPLFDALDLVDGMPLQTMVQHCFARVCTRLQLRSNNWHARLVEVKNVAYTWRQMNFYLSLLPQAGVIEAVHEMLAHFYKQPYPFQERFQPAMSGLQFAVERQYGEVIWRGKGATSHIFVGWSDKRHWLLVE